MSASFDGSRDGSCGWSAVETTSFWSSESWSEEEKEQRRRAVVRKTTSFGAFRLKALRRKPSLPMFGLVETRKSEVK